MNKTEKSAHLVRCIREVQLQGKLLPLKLEWETDEYRKSQLTRAETSMGANGRVGEPEP